MKITEKEVEYVAKLARVHIANEKKEQLTRDMAAIIEFADTLAKIDTTDVRAAAHAIDVNNVFRKDEVVPSYPREEMIANAPHKQAGCYCVPKIVE